MFDHVSIGVADIARSKKFYDAALQPLGYSRLSDGETSLGYGDKAVALWLGATQKPVKADSDSGLHFCFVAPDRAAVDAFQCSKRPAAAAVFHDDQGENRKIENRQRRNEKRNCVGRPGQPADVPRLRTVKPVAIAIHCQDDGRA
jgi:catechol 2,3-dioxygenase-like lactoylglutathione lyase family enzyme